MLKIVNIFKRDIYYLELFITFVLYSIVFVADFPGFSKIDFIFLVTALLEFLITIELVRMILEFIIGKEHSIRLRYMIDAAIMFMVRDLLLVVSDKDAEYSKILMIVGVVFSLFVFRTISMYNKNQSVNTEAIFNGNKGNHNDA